MQMPTYISSKLNASYNINPISILIYGLDVDQILLDSSWTTIVLCGHHKCIIEYVQTKNIPILSHQVCIMNTPTFLSPKTKSLDKWLNYQIVTTNGPWSSYNNYQLKLPYIHVFTLSPNKMPNNPHNHHKMNLFLRTITPSIMMPLKTSLIIHCAFIISTPHPYSMLHEFS
jgi:hypothetical protein